MKLVRGHFPSVLALALVSAPAPARAASLQPVSNWGASGVPTYISMYIYVPDKPATNPPILVVAHYCASLTHDGGGDTQAIAEMVKYTISTYHANADRVYATGDSSGGMMTEALLAVPGYL